jgi:hypothetical protein
MRTGLVTALQTRRIKEKTVMLVSDWTGQLVGERTAELHREVEQRRLVRLARRGKRRAWWERRLLPGWLRGSGEAVREPSTAPSTARSSATP